MELLPTYGEWIVEMRKIAAAGSLELNSEEASHLFGVVNAILRSHLEMDAHIDYDDCFRAKGCAKEIFTMSLKERLAAIAFVSVLRNSHDTVTCLMGENILNESTKIYQTGIVPKTYRELQREEREKERKPLS